MHILVYKSIICVCERVRECVSVREYLRDSTCTNHATQLEIMKTYPFFILTNLTPDSAVQCLFIFH